MRSSLMCRGSRSKLLGQRTSAALNYEFSFALVASRSQRAWVFPVRERPAVAARTAALVRLFGCRRLTAHSGFREYRPSVRGDDRGGPAHGSRTDRTSFGASEWGSHLVSGSVGTLHVR